MVGKWTVQQSRRQFHNIGPTDKRFHLAAGREGSCDDALCLGMNNTVSGFLGGGSFGARSPEATSCVIVEVEDDSSTSRLLMTASRLAYFLASCGSTGSMYLCVLGAVSRGGLVRGAGFGTIILVTVTIPDRGAGEGIVIGIEDLSGVDGVEEGRDVVADELNELDLLEELGEFTGKGVDVVGVALGRKAAAVSVEAAGLVTEGREVGGGGLAEAVRGGKIVE